MDHAQLAEIWLWILALVLAAVVILDGFDLGVGILCLNEKDESGRAAMMDSIEGVWHANQTWLVVAGGVLFGAFPKAYGMLLSTLYVPAGFMLLALMARGIGLEYYYHAPASDRRAWSTLFGLGSLAVAASQGAMLGAVVQGVPMEGGMVFSAPFGWAGSGALLGAAGMICLTGLLGAGWVAGWTGSLGDGSGHRQSAMLFALGSVAFQAGLAAVAPVSGPWSLALAFASVCCAAWCVNRLDAGKKFFPWAGIHALLALVAWLLALRPGFAEPGLTPLSASADAEPLRVLLTGSAIFLPVIIGYTIYQYRVFRAPAPSSPATDL